MNKKRCIIQKVKSTSDPNKVAGAIAGAFREDGIVAVQTIGAGALNQAMKAVAIATAFLEAGGYHLCVRPTFVELDVEGSERTGIRLIIEHRVEDPERPIPDVEFVASSEANDSTPDDTGRRPFFRSKGQGHG